MGSSQSVTSTKSTPTCLQFVEYLVCGYIHQSFYNNKNDDEIKEQFIDLLLTKINIISMRKLFVFVPSKEENRYSNNAKIFHSKCDGKGATITIYNGKRRFGTSIFGGYTNVAWSTPWLGFHSEYKSDKNAFLFSLKHSLKEQFKPKIIKIKSDKIDKAVVHHSNYGPSFGIKDITISHSKDSKTGYIKNEIFIDPQVYNFTSLEDITCNLWFCPRYEVYQVVTK
eukprot:195695_1